uniref:Putative secreted protein n=1 Tax=Amblyomma sculptum TaxID=1581419 RepID=A0A1E1XSB3_AMBSC
MAFMIPIVKKDFELYLGHSSSSRSSSASSTSSGSSGHLSLSSSPPSKCSSRQSSRPVSRCMDDVAAPSGASKFQAVFKKAAAKGPGRSAR